MENTSGLMVLRKRRRWEPVGKRLLMLGFYLRVFFIVFFFFLSDGERGRDVRRTIIDKNGAPGIIDSGTRARRQPRLDDSAEFVLRVTVDRWTVLRSVRMVSFYSFLCHFIFFNFLPFLLCFTFYLSLKSHRRIGDFRRYLDEPIAERTAGIFIRQSGAVAERKGRATLSSKTRIFGVTIFLKKPYLTKIRF